MSAKAGKRPLRSLTAHEKLDAIRRVHDGESKASVARDIGVPESTLRGWCKNEDKISYLSRQSSPDTDESLDHHKDKRIKLEDSVMQPFNLSLKVAAGYSPNSDARYPDYSKSDLDLSRSNLSAKAETPKASQMSERERNRAELARLSVELGLNRPEMFLPQLNNKSNALSDLSANIGLLAQWNNLLMQQQQNLSTSGKKVTAAAADTSTNIASPPLHTGLLTTVDDKQTCPKLPVDKQQSVQESVWYWLKTQQAMLGMNQSQPLSGISSTTPSTANLNNQSAADQSSWFWKWYKLAYGQMPGQQAAATPDKPILYQQLTKDKDQQQNAENLSQDKDFLPKSSFNNNNNNNNKARSVLDNLLFNNNNIVVKKEYEDEDSVSLNEALEHGDKFLKWLESCSDPSVTAMQIMQFRSLLNNVKTGADRKNGDLQNKAKVKRK